MSGDGPALTGVSRGRTITEADVVQFAALTGDLHPQHTDAAWAAESRFGERVAHGMLHTARTNRRNGVGHLRECPTPHNAGS